MQESFISNIDKELIEKFLHEGFIIFPLDDDLVFEKIRKNIYDWSMKILSLAKKPNPNEFFDHTEQFISLDDLNSFRIKLIQEFSKNNKSFRPDIYNVAKNKIDTIVGNELMMQRNVNLTIQFPKDTSSVLPIHSDVWDGNSPFEIVFWLPLTECYRTRSVFILPRQKNIEIFKNFSRYSKLSSEQFYQELKNDVVWC